MRNVVRILCIEDNPGDVGLIKAMLEGSPSNEKFEIVNAGSLAESVTFFSKEVFDIVLLDLFLPDSSGIETFKNLYSQIKKIPIIVLSGLSDESLAVKAVQEGAQDYMVKGQFESSDILRSIRYALERKKFEAQLFEEKTFLSNLFESIQDGICVLDTDRVIVSANSTLEQWYAEDAPLVGKKSCEVLWDKNTPCDEGFEPKLSASKGKEVRIDRKTKDGPVEWIEVFSYPLVDKETGKHSGVIEYVKNITEKKNVQLQLSKINECMLNFGPDPIDNINMLVKLCGDLLVADVVLYNRLENNMLCSIGKWNTPAEFDSVDTAEGHICCDVISEGGSGLKVIRKLQKSKYAQTDKNVKKFKLETYIGMPVKLGSNVIGSLCAVYTKDFIPEEKDSRLMQIVSSAISIEEERLKSEVGLKTSQGRYKSMFDDSPIAMWEEDFSGLKLYLDDLKTKGVKDYREYFDNNPEAVYECVSLIKVLDVNNTTLKMFEAKSKKDFWQGLNSVFTKEAYVSVIESILAVASGKTSFEGETVNQTFSGAQKMCYIRWQVVPGYEKTCSKVLVSMVDITERKRAEESLMVSEERFKNLAENSPNMIFINYHGRIVYVNQKCVDVMGYSKENFYSHNFDFRRLIVPQDMEQLEKNFASELAGNDIDQPRQYGILTKDGKKLDTIISTKLIKFEEDLAILGIVTDITDYIRSQKDLMKERDRAEKYLNLVGSIILALDKNGKVSLINKKGAEILGYSQDEMIGMDWAKKFIPESESKQAAKIFKAVMSENATEKFDEFGENVVVTKDGSEKIISWHNIALYDEHGKPMGTLSSGMDVTERLKMETEREKLNNVLNRTNKKLKQMVLRDPQTGLYNHKYLVDAIESEFSRSRRYASNFSVMLIDIDYFKSINDLYGHKFGDLVIRQFAKQIKKLVRSYDITIRSGGEEFIIISPGTDKKMAITLGDRILSAINLFNFGDSKHTVKLTTCIAVTTYPEDKVYKGMDIINLAESILNKAKDYGGNRVCTIEDIKGKKKEKEKEREVVQSVIADSFGEVKLLKNKIDKLNKQSKQTVVESIFAFAKTIELKDHYTGDHVEKTVDFATRLARELSLEKDEIELIKQAAIVHDLGKVGISDKILLKKKKLSAKEFDEIKKHPQIGADILRPIQFLHDIIPLIYYHHEKWDGSGYPSSLKGEEIPIGARVISLADGYQALSSDRPYRKAFNRKQVLDILRKESGTKYDPHLVDIFVKLMQRHEF